LSESVLLVGGGLLQVAQTLAAQELGLRAIVTDRNPDCVCASLADEFHQVDIYDIDGHITLAKKIPNLKGVFCAALDAEMTISSVAEALGLPGISTEAAMNCKNKAEMRDAFDRAGFSWNPRWGEACSAEWAQTMADEIGYPLIVKNVDNCASRGTSIVRHWEDLIPAYERARAASTTGTALIEELWEGPEQSVEIMFLKDGIVNLNVVDRLFLEKKKYLVEEGHVSPSKLWGAERMVLYQLAENAAKAVGVDFGVFKIDTIWTENGPRILECTARLSGGADSTHTQRYAAGRDFVKIALRQAIGEDVGPDDVEFWCKWHKYSAARAILAQPGCIRTLSGCEEAKSIPGVEEVIMRYGAGDVVPALEDCGARAGFVITQADTYDEAWEIAGKALREVQIEMEEEDVC